MFFDRTRKAFDIELIRYRNKMKMFKSDQTKNRNVQEENNILLIKPKKTMWFFSGCQPKKLKQIKLKFQIYSISKQKSLNFVVTF